MTKSASATASKTPPKKASTPVKRYSMSPKKGVIGGLVEPPKYTDVELPSIRVPNTWERRTHRVSKSFQDILVILLIQVGKGAVDLVGGPDKQPC